MRNTGLWRSAHGPPSPSAERRDFILFSSFFDNPDRFRACRMRFAACIIGFCIGRKSDSGGRGSRTRASVYPAVELKKSAIGHGFVFRWLPSCGCTCNRGHRFRGAPGPQPRVGNERELYHLHSLLALSYDTSCIHLHNCNMCVRECDCMQIGKLQDAVASSTYSAGNLYGNPQHAATRALSAGSGYWCSAGGHEAGETVRDS